MLSYLVLDYWDEKPRLGGRDILGAGQVLVAGRLLSAEIRIGTAIDWVGENPVITVATNTGFSLKCD